MPTYTFNVPQANQQIAATQGPILDNFTYLQSSIGTEHNFDTTDPAKTYHLQASMPNRALDPAALPTGTNGMYYVKGGVPKYYDGTTVSFIDFWTNISTGTFSTAGVGVNVTVATLPVSATFGVIYIWNLNSAVGTGLTFAMSGQFIREGTKICAFTNLIYRGGGLTSPFQLEILPGTNNAIRGSAANASWANETMNYKLYYS